MQKSTVQLAFKFGVCWEKTSENHLGHNTLTWVAEALLFVFLWQRVGCARGVSGESWSFYTLLAIVYNGKAAPFCPEDCTLTDLPLWTTISGEQWSLLTRTEQGFLWQSPEQLLKVYVYTYIYVQYGAAYAIPLKPKKTVTCFLCLFRSLDFYWRSELWYKRRDREDIPGWSC